MMRPMAEAIIAMECDDDCYPEVVPAEGLRMGLE
jgi:hypothetical protein